ncbi:hypothetical protein [Actinomadura bangladeshensis]|uniref:Secreted protein n=1 Tax=Actinomadura bangladeshensis TaxID=453573 RepID=A0A6L9Q8H7_9ACTN|nr:hypothetical protein [Actinomadura bangladeshensis]NEA21769.1 hypothetical protein [Actinomadura bangladeshensis]
MKFPFRHRRTGPAAAALALATTAFGLALGSPASAETVPTFSFDKCPDLPAGADPAYWQCNMAIITGGTFQIGGLDQDIESPIKLTYATGFDPVTLESKFVFGGFQAGTMLVKPGIFGDPVVTAVYAKPEYAGHISSANGIFQLSLKVKVINWSLGSYCYIGGNDDPIKLNLTMGTTSPPPPNTPISGKYPELVSSDPLVVKSTLVDNAFAVPRASGCGLLGGLNWLVNLDAGVPSAAGTNTAIFNQYASWKSYTAL